MSIEAEMSGAVFVRRKTGASPPDINKIRMMAFEQNPAMGPGPIADTLMIPVSTVMSFIEMWAKRLNIPMPEYNAAQMASSDPQLVLDELAEKSSDLERMRQALREQGIDPDEVLAKPDPVEKPAPPGLSAEDEAALAGMGQIDPTS